MSEEGFVIYVVVLLLVGLSLGLTIGYCLWEGNGKYQYNRGYADAIGKMPEFRSFDRRWMR